MKPPTIGVLALQGAFAKHVAMIRSLGAQVQEIRKPQELDICSGLIIPGGESTTILRQMAFANLWNHVLEFSVKKPLFGTCAGLILMSKEIVADPIKPLGILDITVERNAFGRQSESFSSEVEVKLASEPMRRIQALFIRAPRIKSYGPDVKVLATFDKEPILIQQGRHLGATFHPELTEDPAIHRYFLSLVKQALKDAA